MKKVDTAWGRNNEKKPATHPSLKRLSRRFVFLVNLVLLGLGVQLHPSASFAVVSNLTNIDPTQEFATFKTPRFLVTFPKGREKIAELVGKYYEEAQDVLGPWLHWEPLSRVQVLLLDNTDSANGFTTPSAAIGMVLYIIPPEPYYGTNFYEDWIRLLVFHEYTHFLNMDATVGVFRVLRTIFGNQIFANGLWPSWMLEGLAVYAETHYLNGGRGRSTYYETIARTAILEKRLNDSRYVTLDIIHGPNPYAPSGETPYFFGYHLMNQAARIPALMEPQNPSSSAPPLAVNPEPSPLPSPDAVQRTVDGEDALPSSDERLGQYSFRSARRFPYFNNSNLENIIGHDWPAVWNTWVDSLTQKVSRDLEAIRSEPPTAVQFHQPPGTPAPQERGSQDTLGSAISPDGRWIAYLADTADLPAGVFLQEVSTKKTRRIGNRILGAHLSFTPDSKTIIFSSLRQRGDWNTYSDLAAIDVKDGKGDNFRWLTHGARARDPNVVPTGKLISTIIIEGDIQCVKVFRLIQEAPPTGDWEVSEEEKPKTVWCGQPYERLSSPRFDSKGEKLAWSRHLNGKNQEDILEVTISPNLTEDPTRLSQPALARPAVENGFYNRYPFYDREGNLYFVSDFTGVQNLFRLKSGGTTPERVSNLETGLEFPTLLPDQKTIVAAIYRANGDSLGEFSMSGPYSMKRVVEPSTAPAVVSLPSPKPFESEWIPYSAWRTLVPRTWSPTISVQGGGVLLGATLRGFDQVDRHRYSLNLDFNTKVPQPSLAVSYSNRSLGPLVTSSLYSELVEYITGNLGVYAFSRDLGLSVDLERPYEWFLTTWTPSLSLKLIQTSYKTLIPSAAPFPADGFDYQGVLDLGIQFSDTVSSRLALVPESGTQAGIFGRYLPIPGRLGLYKLYGRITHRLHLGELWTRLTGQSPGPTLFAHWVLSPGLRAQWVSETTGSTQSQYAYLRGTTVGTPFSSPAGGPSLSQIPLRGYANQGFISQAALQANLELNFPIYRIYRGISAYPFFFEQLEGSSFFDLSYQPTGVFISRTGEGLFEKTLPAIGGGLSLKMRAFYHLPLTLSLDVQLGLNSQAGGKGEVLFALKGLNLTF